MYSRESCFVVRGRGRFGHGCVYRGFGLSTSCTEAAAFAVSVPSGRVCADASYFPSAPVQTPGGESARRRASGVYRLHQNISTSKHVHVATHRVWSQTLADGDSSVMTAVARVLSEEHVCTSAGPPEASAGQSKASSTYLFRALSLPATTAGGVRSRQGAGFKHQ